MKSATAPLLLAVGAVTTLCGADARAGDDLRITKLNSAPGYTRSDPLGPVQAAPLGFAGSSTDMQKRWWFSRGHADMGLGIGTMSYGLRPVGDLPGLDRPGGVSVLASGTVMTLGMRYRTSDASALYADASNLHAPGVNGDGAVFGKVGFELKSAQSRFNISYGGLGMRLAGDTRMTMRLGRGGLGIFMRSSF